MSIATGNDLILDGAGWYTQDLAEVNDIVEQCCTAWNTFIERRNRVKRLCHRDWAKLEVFNRNGYESPAHIA